MILKFYRKTLNANCSCSFTVFIYNIGRNKRNNDTYYLGIYIFCFHSSNELFLFEQNAYFLILHW